MLADIPSTIRFQIWYPYFSEVLTNISTTVCNATLKEYLANDLDFDAKQCYRHLDCILSNTRESTKAHLSCSTVVLGLTPVLLACIAPDFSQVALLASRRPILTMLLMLGSPVISGVQIRAWKPSEVFEDREGGMRTSLVSVRWAGTISAAEYVIALGSMVNVVMNSVELGNRTILVWKCNAGFLELLWSLAVGAIFFLVCVPFYFTPMARYLQTDETAQMGLTEAPEEFCNMYPQLNRFWHLELLPSASHKRRFHSSELPPMDRTSSALLNLSALLGAIHTVVGIAILSSVLFISVLDTIPIIVRYAASALICRGIVTFEILGMKVDANEYGRDSGTILRAEIH